MTDNVLYHGDNLDVLRGRIIDDESVDLIYLDPPFYSKANYNILFGGGNGGSEAQIHAFDDTWHYFLRRNNQNYRQQSRRRANAPE